jgi:DNA-binding NtrC family response regulator
VGLIPLFAPRALDAALLEALPDFASHLEQLGREHPTFFGECSCFAAPGADGRRLLAVVDEHRLEPILDRLIHLREAEKMLIMRALDQTEGNRTHAAKVLGISVRTLRNKLNEYKAEHGMALDE